MSGAFSTLPLPAAADLLAPDQSEIRLLAALDGGSMVHCRLQPGITTIPVTHRTVEEHWYVLAGQGQIWRASDGREEVTELAPGIALTIPLRTRFQFRNTGSAQLDILIVTMPPWPGADEAVPVEGPWQQSPVPANPAA